MRFKTLEIRWHDSKPISTCDFQSVPWKKARPPVGQETAYASQAYRLATGGEDNHVRLWMVYPNILATSVLQEHSDPSGSTTTLTPRPPRIEYLATLSKHSAAVNVVRFSPNGELIASSGDDGMVIIWAPSTHPQGSVYGSDITPEELQYEKEYWRPRVTFRCTSMQVYDLAWSPSGEYIIAGSTDNVARIFTVEGRCVHEIAEHTHFVQGVAWDPLNEYVATQSSDRSMHIYSISHKQGTLEVHAVGKNARLPHQHTRTPSAYGQSRPRVFRSESVASDVESVTSEMRDESQSQTSRDKDQTPHTPSTSVASTPSTMFPPPSVVDKPSSRRSSFSSQAPGSPSNLGRYGRSPSPMPALPAIRTSPWSSIKMYGDENFTNFFRRLSFSPDGGLLLTPAGQFEDQSILPGPPKTRSEDTPSRGRKGRLSVSTSETNPASASSVYIYSRASFARPPIAQLPGHKKASVAVRFSPVLYELRPNVVGAEGTEKKHATAYGVLEKGKDIGLDVDVVGPASTIAGSSNPMSPHQLRTPLLTPQATPASLPSASPALSPLDQQRPQTPAASIPPSPHSTPSRHNNNHAPISTGAVFALPYRMLFAVVTMDTVAIYDTQQSGPLCLLTKLHYDEFTDMCWSPDGQSLLLSSRDGYCTIIVFDDIIPAYHTQQHTLQLQSIAHHHSLPITSASSNHSSKKRVDRPPTPTPSVEGDTAPSEPATETRPKKKRRVELTRVGDLDI